MSPILVRPVREQLEHDRIIRLLQVRLKRKGDVVANIADSQTMAVKVGPVQVFPDLLVLSPDKGKKILGTVEVETGESVNHLEAMAQWAHLGRARAPFHLYVPVGSVEIARRLATENHANVAEIWTYHTLGDQTRFTLVHRSTPEVTRPTPETRQAPRPSRASTGRTATGTTKRAAVARKAPSARKTASGRTKAAAPARASSAGQKSTAGQKTTRVQKGK